MFSHVVSLGFFCSVALELERVNLRSQSGPFDWTISELAGVRKLIEDHFIDLLNPLYLVQNEQYPYIISNTKYQVDFYHDFKPELTISEQLPAITIKYERRIATFYEMIKEPTLFVRYIKSEAEYQLLEETYDDFLAMLKAYHMANELLLIKNNEIGEEGKPLPNLYSVEKDERDVVARKFLGKNLKLEMYLRGPIIAYEEKQKNALWLREKRRKLKN